MEMHELTPDQKRAARSGVFIGVFLGAIVVGGISFVTQLDDKAFTVIQLTISAAILLMVIHLVNLTTKLSETTDRLKALEEKAQNTESAPKPKDTTE